MIIVLGSGTAVNSVLPVAGYRSEVGSRDNAVAIEVALGGATGGRVCPPVTGYGGRTKSAVVTIAVAIAVAKDIRVKRQINDRGLTFFFGADARAGIRGHHFRRRS